MRNFTLVFTWICAAVGAIVAVLLLFLIQQGIGATMPIIPSVLEVGMFTGAGAGIGLLIDLAVGAWKRSIMKTMAGLAKDSAEPSGGAFPVEVKQTVDKED